MLEPLGVVLGGGADSLHWTALQGASVVTGPLQPEQQGADPRLTQSLLGTKKQPAFKNQHGKEMKNAHPGPPRPRSSLRGSFWKRHDYCCHC